METINVLLLEDNPRDARLLEMVLAGVEEPHYNVFHCKQRNELRSVLDDTKIDVVFISLRFQKTSSIEPVLSMIKIDPQIPIIALCSVLEEALGRSAVQAGAQDFLTKGEYDEEVLVRSIHYAISRQEVINSLTAIEDRTHLIFESNLDGIVVIDKDQVIQYVNPTGEALIGKTKEELVGTKIEFSTRTGSVVDFPRAETEQVTTVQLFTLGIDWNGAPSRLLSLRDITEKVELEKRLSYIATHDHLTGIPNRTIFEDRLKLAIERYFRYSEIDNDDFFFSIILLDLDDFKTINDTYGYPQGDKLLIECANRLVDTMRDSDTVARFSGDEFMIIVENITRFADVEQLIQRINSAIKAPIKLDETTVEITTSMGVSCYPRDGMDYESLFKNADIALTRAKSEKNQYCFFSHKTKNGDLV